MKVIQKLRGIWEPYEFYRWDVLQYGRDKPSRLRWLLSPLLYCVRDFWSRAVCKLKGHRWVDESFAEPDSGCIDMSCSRCGYSPGVHWLY